MQWRTSDRRREQTYRMAGGAPAGINILPGELGCLTNKVRMRTTTKTGKMMTTPAGTETVEFPRNRKGLRKKASRDDRPLLLGALFSSRVGSCMGGGVEGTSFEALWNRSMMVKMACLDGR